MRKHWLDNLRWVTVLLVLFYHVIYFYNNKGVFGGIGGFGEWPACKQYQDVVMYILYPFFMPLLFILAGISARYALEKYPAKDWFKARTRKLLVPSTIGLFVFHWMVGYFNTVVAQNQGLFDGVPGVHYINTLYSKNISVDDVIITGVRILVKTDGNTTIAPTLAGTTGYVVEISNNPMITADNVDEIATWLGTQLIGFKFRKAQITHGSDPSIEAGDVAFVIDGKGNVYPIVISHTVFSVGASQSTV